LKDRREAVFRHLEMASQMRLSMAEHRTKTSPGPQDSHYLFTRFVELMEKTRAAA
jgi:carbamoylphosphate synthase small subunit